MSEKFKAKWPEKYDKTLCSCSDNSQIICPTCLANQAIDACLLAHTSEMAREGKMKMLTQEQVARVAHEVNRAYCEAIGDHSQKKWEEAPDWQCLSAINGVGFHVSNPDATPERSHESWLKEKEANGWRYGPIKDEVKKEHPCFLPYEQLPREQKIKDYLFRAVVHAILF